MSDLTTLSRRSILLAPLAFAACKPWSSDIFRISGLTMGTTYNVVALEGSQPVTQAEVQTAIDGALAEVNAQMSNWDAGSEISRFNAGISTEAQTVSAPLARLMQAAEDVHLASDGRFDTTMGPLIELWGFGAPGAQAMPGDAALESARARSGHRNTLSVGSGTLQKTRPDTQVYLAAIGKGYGADHIGNALQDIGISDFMVEIGGDLFASGRNPDGQPWQIGIETPDSGTGGLYDVVGVSGLGLASSGDYRNYFEQDGTRYSHVIDPATGRPITHKTASATILAQNAMLADAWATAMLILGRERGLEIAEAHDIAVLFIERDADASDLRFRSAQSSRYKALTS